MFGINRKHKTRILISHPYINFLPSHCTQKIALPFPGNLPMLQQLGIGKHLKVMLNTACNPLLQYHCEVLLLLLVKLCVYAIGNVVLNKLSPQFVGGHDFAISSVK
jgi:hypothetical protein